MRGQINLKVRKRKINQSGLYKDKWDNFGVLNLKNVDKGFYRALDKNTGRQYVIHRDEIAFVRLLQNLYGEGDYNILFYGKGKEKGYRRFWDGLIMEGKFFRRKETLGNRQIPSMMERESYGNNTESYIGRYMRTKRPGEWYNL